MAAAATNGPKRQQNQKREEKKVTSANISSSLSMKSVPFTCRCNACTRKCSCQNRQIGVWVTSFPYQKVKRKFIMPRRTRKKKYIFPGWLDETKIKIILNNWDKKKKKKLLGFIFFSRKFLTNTNWNREKWFTR